MNKKLAILTLALALGGADYARAHANHAPPKVTATEPAKAADKPAVTSAEAKARAQIAATAAKPGSKLDKAWGTSTDYKLVETLKITYDTAPADWRLKFSHAKAADKKD